MYDIVKIVNYNVSVHFCNFFIVSQHKLLNLLCLDFNRGIFEEYYKKVNNSLPCHQII